MFLIYEFEFHIIHEIFNNNYHYKMSEYAYNSEDIDISRHSILFNMHTLEYIFNNN